MSGQGEEALPPEGVVPNLDNPKDVLHTINLVSQILSIVSVSVFMAIRCWVKYFLTPPFEIDDCKCLPCYGPPPLPVLAARCSPSPRDGCDSLGMG